MTTWTTKQLATALNLTVQRVGQLVKSGVLPTPTQGHDPFTAVPAYIAFLGRRLTGGDLKSARVAKYQVETAIKELELKQRSGELVSRAAVEREWFSIAQQHKETLMNIPPRLAGVLAAERNQDRIFAVLTKEIDDCLEGLCSEHLKTQDSARARSLP